MPGLRESLKTYYDVTFFSSDSLVVDDDYKVIAEMYFRIKTDAIIHSRQVYNLMDWLGSIGGVEEILTKLLIFLFGGFANFNGVISNLDTLDVKDHSICDPDVDSDEESRTILGLNTYERIGMYFLHTYNCCNKCLS